MKQIVCVQNNRPELSEFILEADYSPLLAVGDLMSECWDMVPSGRLTSLRLKKSLTSIYKQLLETENSKKR